MVNPNKDKILAAAAEFYQLKKWDKAIDLYKKLLNEDPGNFDYRNLLGDTYSFKGATDNAMQEFQTIATGYEKQGLINQAISVNKKIIRINNEDIDCYKRLANLYLQQDLIGDANAYFLRIIELYKKRGDFPNVIAVYKKVVEINPQNTQIHLKLAEILEQQGILKRAASEYAVIAQKHIDSNQVSKAAIYLNKAKLLDQDEPRYRFDLILILHQINKPHLSVREVKPFLTRFKLARMLEMLEKLIAQNESKAIIEPLLRDIAAVYVGRGEPLQSIADFAYKHNIYAVAQETLEELHSLLPNDETIVLRIEEIKSIMGLDGHDHSIFDAPDGADNVEEEDPELAVSQFGEADLSADTAAAPLVDAGDELVLDIGGAQSGEPLDLSSAGPEEDQDELPPAGAEFALDIDIGDAQYEPEQLCTAELPPALPTEVVDTEQEAADSLLDEDDIAGLVGVAPLMESAPVGGKAAALPPIFELNEDDVVDLQTLDLGLEDALPGAAQSSLGDENEVDLVGYGSVADAGFDRFAGIAADEPIPVAAELVIIDDDLPDDILQQMVAQPEAVAGQGLNLLLVEDVLPEEEPALSTAAPHEIDIAAHESAVEAIVPGAAEEYDDGAGDRTSIFMEPIDVGLMVDDLFGAVPPRELVKEAEVLIAASKLDEAVAKLEECLKVDPQHDQALCYLAGIYQRRGDSRSAITCYRQAIDANPDNQPALEQLGDLLFKEGNYKAAKLIIEQLYNSSPEQIEYLSTLGEINFHLGSYEQALEYFYNLVLLDPTNASRFSGRVDEINKILYQASQSQGDEDVAVEMDISEQIDDLFIEVEEEIIPTSAETVAAVVEPAQFELPADPRTVSADDSLDLDLIMAFEEAKIFVHHGLWDRAISELERILQISPGNQMAEKMLATAHQKLSAKGLAPAGSDAAPDTDRTGGFDLSWTDAEAAAPEPEEDYDSHFNLGTAYREMGLFDEAISEFEIASHHTPIAIAANRNIAECLAEKGLFDLAIARYRDILKEKSMESWDRMAIQYSVALVYKTTKCFKKAYQVLSHIYSIQPDYKNVAGEMMQIKKMIDRSS